MRKTLLNTENGGLPSEKPIGSSSPLLL